MKLNKLIINQFNNFLYIFVLQVIENH